MTYKRKEVIEGATLYLGDCLEILPTLPKVDAVVTDPPYGIAYQHSGGGFGRHNVRNALQPIANDCRPFDPTPFIGIAPKVLMFGADHYRARLPDGGTFIAWDKHCGKGPNDSFADCEFAWTNAKTKRNVIRCLWKGIVSVKAGEDGGARPHPTTKPQAVMLACIRIVGEAASILDPFMGSGSTGVACANLGRKFIGIEIEERYFDIACERIENAYRQARLFA